MGLRRRFLLAARAEDRHLYVIISYLQIYVSFVLYRAAGSCAHRVGRKSGACPRR
jgi:hypothetical protein